MSALLPAMTIAPQPVTDPPTDAGPFLPDHVEVAIVGAGFGGLGAAIQLKRAGFEDIVVLERAAGVGGTWWANTYPGCQCDVPSNLYSFSFAPRPDWSHSYPEQPEIRDYLRDCAERFGVMPRTRLGCEVTEAAWDDEERLWRIETSLGRLSARYLVAAPGLLSEPSTPDIPGLESFGGTIFHSARWNHDHELEGERVALIGTGATAVQIAPRIRDVVKRLYVFQRTPPWVIPHLDRPVGERLKRLYRRVPLAQRLARAVVYGLRETFVVGFTRDRRLLRLGEAVGRLQLRRQVRDPELRAKLLPDYEIGCKRLTLSDEWYPTLTAPNVDVVTSGIEEVREGSIVIADGAELAVDTIILATGFSPTDPPIAHRLKDGEGRTLSEVWAGSPQAYLGTSVAGFPNFFMLYGPNLNLSHTSIVYMMEAQITYLVEAVRTMRARGLATLDVRRPVQDEWNADLQRRLEGSVWDKGGCTSWYLDANGRNSIQWPDFTFNFRRRTRTFTPGDYHLEPLSDGRPEPELVGAG